MSSVRMNILDKISECLKFMTTANGYHNTVKQVYKGFKSYNQINEYPVLFYGLGAETTEHVSETFTTMYQKCEAHIVVYFQGSDLTKEYEEWIRDLKRFIMQSSDISNNKTLQLNEVNYVDSWVMRDVQPYTDYDKNIGTVWITFDINYTEGTETL